MTARKMPNLIYTGPGISPLVGPKSTKRTIVIASGGFDPLHLGHINFFDAAAELADELVVAINSDSWLERKKGSAFMPYTEREGIINRLDMVTHTIRFNDDDGTAIDAIKICLDIFEDANIIFANGGDRNLDNIPELTAFEDVWRVAFKFGVGGDKANSSSAILEDWSSRTK